MPRKNIPLRPNRPSRRRDQKPSARRISPSPTHTLTVQKPYCAPCRRKVLKALEPFGVVVLNREGSMNERTVKTDLRTIGQRLKIEMRTFENLKYAGVGLIQYLPRANECDVVVRSGQAGWAEDLLCASGWFVITGGHIDGRGLDSTFGSGGKLPQSKWSQHTADWARGQARYAGLSGKLAALDDDGADCEKAKRAWSEVLKLRG